MHAPEGPGGKERVRVTPLLAARTRSDSLQDQGLARKPASVISWRCRMSAPVSHLT
jgi:hypothetical protein